MQYATRSDASLKSIDPANYISSWRHHIVRYFCWATYGTVCQPHSSTKTSAQPKVTVLHT